MKKILAIALSLIVSVFPFLSARNIASASADPLVWLAYSNGTASGGSNVTVSAAAESSCLGGWAVALPKNNVESESAVFVSTNGNPIDLRDYTNLEFLIRSHGTVFAGGARQYHAIGLTSNRASSVALTNLSPNAWTDNNVQVSVDTLLSKLTDPATDPDPAQITGFYLFFWGGTQPTYDGTFSLSPVKLTGYRGSHVIAASSGPNGAVTPAGSTTVPHGQSMTYTITPDTGFEIAKVLVDGLAVSAGANGEYVFQNVDRAHTISALFKSLSEPPADADIPDSMKSGGIGTLDKPDRQVPVLETKTITSFEEGVSGVVYSNVVFYNGGAYDTTARHGGSRSVKLPPYGAPGVDSGARLLLYGGQSTWNTWDELGPYNLDNTYFLSMWVMLDKPSSLRGNAGNTEFFFLSSNAANPWIDHMKFTFDANYVFPAGEWFNLCVPLAAGNYSGFVDVITTGDFSLGNVLRFAAYNSTGNGATIWIDDVQVKKLGTIADTDWTLQYPDLSVQPFESCDGPAAGKVAFYENTTGLGTSSESKVTNRLSGVRNPYTAEGSGSWMLSGTERISVKEYWNDTISPLTLPNSRNQYLAFDLMIDDVSKLETDVTVTSAYGENGTEGLGSMEWTVKAYELENGWNRLILPYNAANAPVGLGYATVRRNQGGSVNANGEFAVNQFKVQFDVQKTAFATVAVDNIKLLYTPGVQPAALTAKAAVSDITDSSVKLTWPKAADNEAGTVGGYQITREAYDVNFEDWFPEGDAVLVDGADTLGAKLEGLSPETDYRFTVRAVSNINESPRVTVAIYAPSEKITTLAAPESTDPGPGPGEGGPEEGNPGGGSPETGDRSFPAAALALICVLLTAGACGKRRVKKWSSSR